MFRYPPVLYSTAGAGAFATGWSLVPMNSIAYADSGYLNVDGTFYLRAGVYILTGSVSGNTNSVQAAIAPAGQTPLALNPSTIILASLGSVFGAAVFQGLLKVPDDGSGGSHLGVYQAWNDQVNLGIESTGGGLPEVYASLVLIPHSCSRTPLEFAVGQSNLPQPVRIQPRTWSPLYLNQVRSIEDAPPPDVSISQPTGLSFSIPAGAYLVTGAVMSNLSGGVCALVFFDSDTGTFGPPSKETLLLESYAGADGNCDFLGLVVVPDDGSGGSELALLGFAEARGAPTIAYFGTPVGTGINAYSFLSFSRLDDDIACAPFSPLPDFFSVSQSLPSGQNAPRPLFSGTSYAQVLLTQVTGSAAPPLLNGAFLLPAGTWYVRGATCSPDGAPLPAGGQAKSRALLGAVIDPENTPTLNMAKVFLQSTSGGNESSELSGLITVPVPQWVGLYVLYYAGVDYGSSVSSGLPEVYGQVNFIRKQ